jgi:thiosulfate/3-mercaptopyruvate sulfurtransferase
VDLAQGHADGPRSARAFEPAATRRRIEVDELAKRLGDPDLYLLDTRREDEVTGRTRAAPRGGHIPGAAHLDWREALTRDGRLKPRDELATLFAEPLAAQEVATYCQSGVRAAHTALLLEHLGHPRVRMYLSSWSEWGGREDTPVATGPARRPDVVPR